MTNELSTERAIEALYTVRAYYASLTAGYPKGKDCRGIGDVMCNEIANSCLMAINTLEQQPCEDCISRQKALDCFEQTNTRQGAKYAIETLPSVTPQRQKGHWIIIDDCELFMAKCSECGEIVDSRMINKYPYCHCGAEMGGADETN